MPTMARLVAESGSLEGQVFPVDPGVTLGREKHNSIAMPENRKASREHCKIWREGPQRYSIADFGSTNGTLVNDEKVVRQPLADGDRIRIGEDVFRFELDEEEKPKPKVRAPAEARPDLASVLRGDAPPSRPPQGTGATDASQIEIKQRLLQYSKKSRKGSIAGADMGQMAGLGKWVLILVALGVAVGIALAARACMVTARERQLPPAEEAPEGP